MPWVFGQVNLWIRIVQFCILHWCVVLSLQMLQQSWLREFQVPQSQRCPWQENHSVIQWATNPENQKANSSSLHLCFIWLRYSWLWLRNTPPHSYFTQPAVQAHVYGPLHRNLLLPSRTLNETIWTHLLPISSSAVSEASPPYTLKHFHWNLPAAARLHFNIRV